MAQDTVYSTPYYIPYSQVSKPVKDQFRYFIGISFRYKIIEPKELMTFDLGAVTKTKAKALGLLHKLHDESCYLSIIIDRLTEQTVSILIEDDKFLLTRQT